MLRVDQIIKNIQNLNTLIKFYMNKTNMARKQLEKELQFFLEPLEDYLGIYIKEFQKNIIPEHTKYKYIVCLIHILHIFLLINEIFTVFFTIIYSAVLYYLFNNIGNSVYCMQ